MDNRKISLCIPTYNRVDVLIESFSKVISDERISDIFISDDASDIEIFQQVRSMIEVLNQTRGNKITMSRNLSNQDCFRNKQHAVLGAQSEWLVLLDSDNIIDTDYLDRLYEIENWDADTVYCPVWAMPHFDYRAFSGLTVDRSNVSEHIDKPMFQTALNTMNFFINKESYLDAWIGDIDPIVCDSIYFNYCFLKSGRKIHFLENLFYQHKVWDESHYKLNVGRTNPGLAKEIENNLRNLK